MIVRINEREKTKQDLQVRLSEAMLHLGEEVCLSEALLHLGRSESLETQASSSPRLGFLRLGGDLHLCERSYT